MRKMEEGSVASWTVVTWSFEPECSFLLVSPLSSGMLWTSVANRNTYAINITMARTVAGNGSSDTMQTQSRAGAGKGETHAVVWACVLGP